MRPDRRITSTIAREAERDARAARVRQRRTEVRLMLRSLARQLQRAAHAIDENHAAVAASKRNDALAGSHEAENMRSRRVASRSSCHVHGREAPAARLRESFFLSGLFVLQAR